MSGDLVAEFLAREQEELGELKNDIFGESESPLDGFNAALQFDPTNFVSPDEVNGFKTEAGGYNDGQYEGSMNDFMETPTDAYGVTPVGETGADSFGLQNKRISPVKCVDSDTMLAWIADFQRGIEEKDRLEQNSCKELEEQAKQELETWYANYNDQLVSKTSLNRSNNQVDCSGVYEDAIGIRASYDDEKMWTRVCSMCNIQDKTPKTAKDTSRMRSLLLSLKNPSASP